MVLTVTLNPLLEKRYFFDFIDLASDNRAQSLRLLAGGKGINVSRQLNLLGVTNQAFLFLGGENGRILRRILTEEKINFVPINIRDNIREGYVFVDLNNNRKYSFFGLNFQVSEKEINEFIDKLKKAIANCEIAVFSGSVPCDSCFEILYEGLKACKEFDKISIVDVYGSGLKRLVEFGPIALHNNLNEIKKSFNVELISEKDKIDFILSLYEKGVKRVFITNGGEEFYCSNFDFIYKVKPKKVNEIDSTGSGDAFVAGLAYSFFRDLTFEESIKISSALGAVNSLSYDVCSTTFDEKLFENYYPEIRQIGKKINLLF